MKKPGDILPPEQDVRISDICDHEIKRENISGGITDAGQKEGHAGNRWKLRNRALYGKGSPGCGMYCI